MRLSRPLVAAIVGALAALPTALAADTRADASRFIVSLHANVSEHWTYSSSTKSAGCTTAVTASGARSFSLRSPDGSSIAMRWSGGTSRARFGGRIAVAGIIVQSGTKTTDVTGPNGSCDAGTHRQTCGRLRAAISRRNVGIVSPRRHRLALTPLRRVAPSGFNTECPGQPTAISRLSNGLELADAAYSERVLAAPATGGLTLEGEAEVTNDFLTPSGHVVQRIHWTLLFRRVG